MVGGGGRICLVGIYTVLVAIDKESFRISMDDLARATLAVLEKPCAQCGKHYTACTCWAEALANGKIKIPQRYFVRDD